VGMAKKVKRKTGKSMIRKVIVIFIVFIFVASLVAIYQVYKGIYRPNVFIKDKGRQYLYIRTGSKFEDVIKSLDENNLIKNHFFFKLLAEKMNYSNNIKPGRYKLRNYMSNKELIELLRSGRQTPVKITINNIRDKEQLCEKISENIESDKKSLEDVLSNESYLSSIGFNSNNILTLFIPNTYELLWNTSALEFMKKMEYEYDLFWNEERKNKAKNINLRPVEVSILASIVELETVKRDERNTVAGVYINRLKKGMLLQADPTVIYANGDYSIKRVLSKHLLYNSPYNTYIHKGLPPGPICIPSITSIDAVLNFNKTNYLYFCASEDFSGHHNFAATIEEHKINARKYQRELNRRKIIN
jgi:UPF0755 protein